MLGVRCAARGVVRPPLRTTLRLPPRRCCAAASTLAIDGGPSTVPPESPLPTIANSSGRSIGAEEQAAVAATLESGNLAYITGTQVKEFQRAFGEVYGTSNTVAVNSGTSAINTALVYLNPEPGDEVLVSPVTDMGTVIAILQQLCVPVFVDIDPLTQNIDPGAIEAALSDRTRAICVTHIYGAAADMDPIMEIAERHELFVVEDCAQAMGAEWAGKAVGSLGDLGAFSLPRASGGGPQ